MEDPVALMMIEIKDEYGKYPASGRPIDAWILAADRKSDSHVAGLRYSVRGGQAWRMLPNELPPWHVVHQQTQRWIKAGVFEAIVHDLRRILRLPDERRSRPTAAIFDSRTLQSTPESGGRAGYDGAKRRKGSKTHMAVDTLGHLLALHVTAATRRTGTKSNDSPGTCRRRLATTCNWLGLTKATPATGPPTPRRGTGSN